MNHGGESHFKWSWYLLHVMGWGGISRPPFKVQPSFVVPESDWFMCQCFLIKKCAEERKRSVEVLTFFKLLYYLVSVQIAYLQLVPSQLVRCLVMCEFVELSEYPLWSPTSPQSTGWDPLVYTCWLQIQLPMYLASCKCVDSSKCWWTVEICLDTSISGDSIVVMRPKF